MVSIRVSWRRSEGNFNHAISSGVRHREFADNDRAINQEASNTSALLNYQGAWRDGALYAADIQSNLSVNIEENVQDILLSGEFKNAIGRADLALGHQSIEGAGSGTSFSANFGTSIVSERTTFAYGGNESAESALLLDIEGTADRGVFDILINDRFHSKASVNDKIVVPLLAYETYSVDLKDAGSEFISFDGRREITTLYPGNVRRVGFRADNLYVLIGRVVAFNPACDIDATDGSKIRDCWQPVAKAKVEELTIPVRTEEDGYIQLEVTGNLTQLTFVSDTLRCKIDVPYQLAEDSLIYAEEDLRCFTQAQGETLKSKLFDLEKTLAEDTADDAPHSYDATVIETPQQSKDEAPGQMDNTGAFLMDSTQPIENTQSVEPLQNANEPVADESSQDGRCKRIKSVEVVGREQRTIEKTILVCEEE